MAKKKKGPAPRHVLTEGWNDGRDCVDLFAQGITHDKFYRWLEEHSAIGPVKVNIPSKNPRKKKDKTEKKKEDKPPLKVTPMPPADQDYGMPPEYSEDALAEEFTRTYSEILKRCGKQWYAWVGNIWVKDKTFLAVDYARKVCKTITNQILSRTDLGNKQGRLAEKLSTHRMFNAVQGIATSDRAHVLKKSVFDAQAWILNTPDGIVDLKTGEIRPCTKEDFCTLTTHVSPVVGDCPRWIEFLDQATNNDPELIRYLKRIIGYCLTGAVMEHKFFFCYGTGTNGKGTFLNTLDFLLGSYAKVAASQTFVQGRFNQHTQELATLQGSRLVNAQELDEGSRWNETRLKQMTGGDPITCRNMYEGDFTYYPTFKILFAGNHKPILKNVDAAMRRRMLLIPFDVEIDESKIDQHLQHNLVKYEGATILQWAVEGCLDWQANTLSPPQRVRVRTDEYFEDEDRIGQFFSECCQMGNGLRVLTAKLYQGYRDWCEKSGQHALAKPRFVSQIASKGYRSKNRAGNMCVIGLELLDAHTQDHE